MPNEKNGTFSAYLREKALQIITRDFYFVILEYLSTSFIRIFQPPLIGLNVRFLRMYLAKSIDPKICKNCPRNLW